MPLRMHSREGEDNNNFLRDLVKTQSNLEKKNTQKRMVEQKKRMSLRHLGVGWCSFINTKKKRNVNHKKKKRDPYFERKRRTARSRLRNYPSRKRRVVKQTKQKTNETVCVCKRERERERERRKREREEADFLSGPPNGGSDTKNSRE